MKPESERRSLVLVIEQDNGGRRGIRKLLASMGFDVVQTSNGLAGLELLQRLPHCFEFVLTDIDLPGLPGAVVIETLRLFRPDLPVLCMADVNSVRVPAATSGCLTKPLQPEELRLQVQAALAKSTPAWEAAWAPVSEAAAVRARARYSEARSLVDAALELARGYGAD